MPWFLTIGSTIVLIAIAWFLVDNLYWFRNAVFRGASSEEYRMEMFHLHLAMVKRSVGLFSGFALLFLGTGVVFYTMREQTHIESEAHDWKVKIATASPGLIAMLLGVVLLLGTIMSKDHFDWSYDQEPTVTDEEKGDHPLKQPKEQPLKQPKEEPLKQTNGQPLKQPEELPLVQPKEQPLVQPKEQPLKQRKKHKPLNQPNATKQ
jgi:hypothetical protein